MRGVNKVILVGNVGKDPEVKYTQSGMAIANISLATTSVRKDRDGNPQENTEWHRVKFFDRKAETIGEHVKKGQQLYVEGVLHYDKYTDRDGVERYTTDIIANDFQFLGGRGDGQRNSRDDNRRPARQPERREPPPAKEHDFGERFADDDIPF